MGSDKVYLHIPLTDCLVIKGECQLSHGNSYKIMEVRTIIMKVVRQFGFYIKRVDNDLNKTSFGPKIWSLEMNA